jgi:integrase
VCRRSWLYRCRHKHDLRHAGNHLAAGSGAALRDLMARMGHDSERAALIYQNFRTMHAGADMRITDAIDVYVPAERVKGGDEDGRGRDAGAYWVMAR